jgi:hypothetical protein
LGGLQWKKKKSKYPIIQSTVDVDVESKEETLALMSVQDSSSISAASSNCFHGSQEFHGSTDLETSVVSSGSRISWNFALCGQTGLEMVVDKRDPSNNCRGPNYLAKYIRSIQAVEWLLKMDRLRYFIAFH